MSQMTRPTHIVEILKNSAKVLKSEETALLEKYLVELETKQPDRPAYIAEILKTIGTYYATDGAIALDTYVTNLEAKRQTMLSDNSLDIASTKRSPQWSHNRRVQLEKQRRERIYRKRHNNS